MSSIISRSVPHLVRLINYNLISHYTPSRTFVVHHISRCFHHRLRKHACHAFTAYDQELHQTHHASSHPIAVPLLVFGSTHLSFQHQKNIHTIQQRSNCAGGCANSETARERHYKFDHYMDRDPKCCTTIESALSGTNRVVDTFFNNSMKNCILYYRWLV